MRIGDALYFSPRITFSELDILGDHFPYQLHDRFLGYYISPSQVLADSGHAFGSGLLLVSCIDALALYETGNSEVGFRFKRWCEENLPSFADKGRRDRFYRFFRNGLVHEGRIKNGGEFSLDPGMTIIDNPPIMSINPRYLAEEVIDGLDRFVAKIQDDRVLRQAVNRRIANYFSLELGA